MQAPGNKATIPLGSRGILVSCTTSKEQQAGREAVDLFTEVGLQELGLGVGRCAISWLLPSRAVSWLPCADAHQ